jgi:hypothetical protein
LAELGLGWDYQLIELSNYRITDLRPRWAQARLVSKATSQTTQRTTSSATSVRLADLPLELLRHPTDVQPHLAVVRVDETSETLTA